MEATFTDNILVFILFSIFNTVFSLKFPETSIDHRKWLYRERSWEDGGAVYQRVFKIKLWKDRLPELSDFVKVVFPRKHLASFRKDYLETYVAESCRSELTHWCIILSSFLFSFWSNYRKTFTMILLAVVLNMPFIIIQRYNRPRILLLLARSTGKKNKETKMSDNNDCHTEKQHIGSVLFLSANDTGHGHKSIVDALQQQITKLDPDIRISVVDGFTLGKKMLHMASSLYNPLVANMPTLWGLCYRMGNRFTKYVNAFVSKSIRSKLLSCLENACPDVIVSVHGIFVGSVLNILEEEQLKIPFITLIADLDNVSALWADDRAKYTLCPSMESKRTMRSLGIPEEKLKLVDFPVRKDFCDSTPVAPKEGMIEKEASILMVSGSQGSKKTMKMAKNILEGSDCGISIIAGNNLSLKQYLEKKLSPYIGNRAQVYGFTNDMQKHMLEADILIVRASPNVLMEAITLCRPVVVSGALKGQEEKNPEYIARYNLGVVCGDIKALAGQIRELLSENGKKLREIHAAQVKFRNARAAEEIAEFIIHSGSRVKGVYPLPFESDENIHYIAKSGSAKLSI